MIHIHVTKKLLAKLPVNENGQLPVEHSPWLEQQRGQSSPLSGWHANLLTLQRRNCVLLVHDETRFPLLITCLTKPDFAKLDWWFVDTLMNTLLKCGATDAQMQAAHDALAPLQIDSQCNRSVQGTLNRMAGDLEHMLWYDQANIADLSGIRTGVWLADSSCNVKGKKDCIWPQQAMLELLDSLLVSAESSALPEPVADNVVSLDAYRSR